MDLPLPIPAYELISSIKVGDTVSAYCSILGCNVTGKVSRALGVNEWEAICNGKPYCIQPGNIVGLVRAGANAHRVQDKPPKEPKSEKKPVTP
jgi:hypothetical protein